MTEQLFVAFMLGLVGGIVPGPVLAAIFTEILQSGLYTSFRIAFWAMITETMVALVSVVAFSSFALSTSFFNAWSVVGAGILVSIATQLWGIRSLDIDKKISFSAAKIASMILANGVLWTFWITVCIPKAVALGAQIPLGQYIFLGVVEFGWIISTVGVAYVFSVFRNALSDPKVVPYMFRGFAVVFVYFAINMLYTSAVFFIH